MNDVRLWYHGEDGRRTVQITTQTGESEVIAAAGVVIDGEQFDLVGLDRIVDADTGEVSYNVGIWFDNPDDHEGDWRTVFTITADDVRDRLAARRALPDYNEGPFQSPDEVST